jgi:cation:H+ antiporter
MNFLLLILGIAGLWIGTELVIGGALAIAKKHQLSEFFVGLVVLSIGSDLPELAVAIDAGIKGLMGQDASGIVTGASIGSLVAQIGFVMGFAGLMAYLTLPKRFIYQHGTMLLGATLLLFLWAFDGAITRIEGLSLLTMYGIYVVLLLPKEPAPDNIEVPLLGKVTHPWVLLFAGLGVVTIGSELTVDSAVALARAFDISEALISVLFIGLGTSLPELSISIASIVKKRVHLSVGNIIGSNIFDTLVPIGAAAVISPLIFERGLLVFDLPFVFLLTAVVLFFFARVRGLQKPEAAIVLGLYLSYVLIKLMSW